jgi:hypothetical protein
MPESNYKKYTKFLKKILLALKPRFSFHYVAYTIMTILVVFSIISIAKATTPNPGHPWSQVGDGVFVFTSGQTSIPYTYTFPAANATVLTTNAAVTLAQGGTGTSLADPNADQCMMWDDSEGVIAWVSCATGETDPNSLHLDQSTPQTITGGAPYIPAINGGAAANDDLTLQGTTNATRTSSYIILQPNGGNVGIGTSTPAAKLYVSQTGTATNNYGIYGYAGGAGTNNYAGYFDAESASGNNFALYTNVGNVALGATSGSVGIGLSTPATEKLEVVGNIYINNSGGYLKFNNGFKITDGAGTLTVTGSNGTDVIMVFDEL